MIICFDRNWLSKLESIDVALPAHICQTFPKDVPSVKPAGWIRNRYTTWGQLGCTDLLTHGGDLDLCRQVWIGGSVHLASATRNSETVLALETGRLTRCEGCLAVGQGVACLG